MINNKSFTEPEKIVEQFNIPFTEIGPKLASHLLQNNCNFKQYIPETNTTFKFRNISVKTVIEVLKSLASGKATGLDKISAKLLKISASAIADSLCRIFNKSAETGIFPTEWKNAKVFPLFKKDNKTDPNNYRPISILPAIAKVFERIIYNQLYDYLSHNDILSKHQSNFRSLHSTVTTLLEATNEWYLDIDKGNKSQ